MQLFKFLKTFFRLPAFVMLLSFRCVTPLYVQFIAQLTKIRKAFIIFFLSSISIRKFLHYSPFKGLGCFLFILLFITQKINAQQTADTNYVDTVSMANPDTTVSYDDEDDGYVDTTLQHIYDTSQYFFNTKDYLNDPYTKEKITQRHLIDADVNELKNEDDFWYIPAIEKLELRLKTDPKFRDSLLNAKNHELHDENDNSFTQQTWFATLIWIIIIGVFVAAIIYFLLQNKINLFSKDSASSADDEDRETQEDIFSLSYSKLIQKAEKENDYRVAIRLMFLQTLKLLSETNNIQYQADYTNLHYLQQLHQTKFYTEFFKATHSYEYVWYGKFDISNERYMAIKNDFLKLQHKIT